MVLDGNDKNITQNTINTFNEFTGETCPKGTMRLVLLDTFVDYIVQPLLLSIKLQCTMVTRTIVNHLQPRQKKKKKTEKIK